MNIDQLIAEVREVVKPYYLTNDSAHLIDHADDVVASAMLICDRLEVSPHFRRLAVIAAFWHDVHTDQRKVHEVLAHDTVISVDVEHLNVLFDDDREMIAVACLEHRASYRGEMASLLSQVISAADRGMPDFALYVERSVAYSTSKLKQTGPMAELRALAHVCNKFSMSNNLRYPEFYMDMFILEIHKLWDTIIAIQSDNELKAFIDANLLYTRSGRPDSRWTDSFDEWELDDYSLTDEGWASIKKYLDKYLEG